LQAAINAATGGPIYFGNDGVSLTPAAEQALTQVSDKLKACPDARVTVNGYTDNSGPDNVNVPLSAQRATTVVQFLVAHGVASDHVVAKGLGPANPIAPNDTNEGRAKNRRAEIVVG
jgi:peptidoglycan-binding protein ArfA